MSQYQSQVDKERSPDPSYQPGLTWGGRHGEAAGAGGDPIEPGSGDFEEDEFLATGWDATSAAGSTSVASNVYRHEYDHGRRYHSYKNGRYPIPNDDQEQNREDMKHAMMMELTVSALWILYRLSKS